MNETMVSELADSNGKVIDGAKLLIPVAARGTGTTGALQATALPPTSITVYPNPARETLNIAFETCNPQPAICTLQLVNLQGVTMLNQQPISLSAGWHKVQADLRGLTPGVYFLRITMNGETVNRKVVISR
jgi:hypothetical protein